MIGRWIKVLGSPRAAFAYHDPRAWGWVAPLVLLLALSVLAGAAALWSGSATVALEQVEAQFDAQGTPAAQREQGLAMVRAFAYAGPLVLGPLFSLLWAVGMAGALTLLGLVLQPGGQPVGFRRALSVSSHASLATCLGLVALCLGGLSGNPAPSTSLAHLGAPGSGLSALGARLDPALILYYVVLAAGIQASLGFGRAVALSVSGGLYLSASALGLVGALVGGAFKVQAS